MIEVTVDANPVTENELGAIVGAVTIVDPDLGDVHTLTVDNPRFEIVEGVLKLKDDQSLDFETEPTVIVSVTATDQDGLSVTSDVTINVTDVIEAPTSIDLSNAAIAENSAADTVVGVLSAFPDDENVTFSLVDNGDGRFVLVGNEIRVANSILLDFESATTHTIQVRAVNGAG